MGVFAIDALIDARFSPRRLLSARNMYVVVPVVVALAVWFAYPTKVVGTIRAMVNRPAGADPWTLDGLLFYPRSLLRVAGSPAMLAVLLAGVAGAWPMRRAPNVRLLLVLAAAQFVLGELHHTKENRHILPIVPPILLLTGATVARLVHAVAARERGAPARRMAVVLGVAFVGLVAAQLWRAGTTAGANGTAPPAGSTGLGPSRAGRDDRSGSRARRARPVVGSVPSATGSASRGLGPRRRPATSLHRAFRRDRPA